MQLYFTINTPHHWVTLDHKGIRDSGICDSLEDLPLENNYQRIIAVVPGEQVVTGSVTIPVRNRQKLLAAIPYAIEESLISGVDELHFVLLSAASGNNAIYAYASRADMGEWMSRLTAAGVKADAMLPDYLLLPYQDDTSSTLVRVSADRILIRSHRYMGSVIDESALPVWLRDHGLEKPLKVATDSFAELVTEQGAQDVTVVVTEADVEAWLQNGVPDNDSNLLQGDYQTGDKRGGWSAYWAAAAVLLLTVVTMAVSDIAEYTGLKRMQQTLDQEMSSIYTELFPGGKQVPGKLRVQMKNQVQALSQKHAVDQFTYLLTSSAGVLKQAGIDIVELQYTDNTLTIICELKDFSHLDKLKQALQRSRSISARLVQSGSRGSRVQARFEITGAPA